MRIPISVLLSSILAAVSLVSCQNASPPAQKLASAQPAQKPLPAWIKSEASVKNGRQIKFATKIIEITRETRGEVPAERYRKKMSDGELQRYLRSISQTKGADIMTSPTVTTREGKSASIRIGRDFTYPADGGASTEMTTDYAGVSNYVRARPARDGKKIKVDVLAEVKEFEGFDRADPDHQRPVFAVRRAGSDSSIELASGESIVMGGVIREKQQDVEDSVPFLGDIPLLGRAFRNRETHTLWTELIVIVTPTVVKK